MGERDHEVIAALLLSLLCFVLIGGVLLAFLVIRWQGRRAHAVPRAGAGLPPELPPSPGLRPAFLKRPACWLAIRNCNVRAVQQALSLHNPQPCSWAEGLAGDGEQKIFVSPPVFGWILVVGAALPEPDDDVDACFRFLLDLSRKLGQIQFFSANLMLDYHAWAQIEAGRVTRAYAWAGRTLWNQGKITPAERDLRLKCYDYAETAELPLFCQPEAGSANADKVHLLAARWSIDPEEIDERFTRQEWGVVGEPSRHF